MTKTIHIKKGLDIPIKGAANSQVEHLAITKEVGLDLTEFSSLVLRSLVKENDKVKLGQPIAFDIHNKNRVFLSPATGNVRSIQHGSRHRISTIALQDVRDDEEFRFPKVKENLTKEEIIEYLLTFGLFSYIQKRPLNEVANPKKLPDSIFISALESAPFAPPASTAYLGSESAFQHAIYLLGQIAQVYLVYEEACFASIKGATLIHITGKHPKANHSVHIEKISPIVDLKQCIWTLRTDGVVAIGKAFQEQKMLTRKTIAIAGEGIHAKERKLYNVHIGSSIHELLENKLINKDFRIISGDPLTGKDTLDFLGFSHNVISTVKQPQKAKPLHFLRYGNSRYTFSNGYGSALSRIRAKLFSFTTSYNGEERPFVDGAIYDRVLPMRIPVEALIKALLAKDFDEAVKLGLLEVAPEDFALPEFICPSKIPFMQIVKDGIDEYKRLLS